MVSPCVPADRVFGPNAHSRQVYEEGARDVVLSALTGLNGNFSVIGDSAGGGGGRVGWRGSGGVPFPGHELLVGNLTSLGSV